MSETEDDYRVILTEPAQNDLDTIAAYLSTEAGSTIAANYMHRIEMAIVDLDHMPLRFAAGDLGLRQRPVGSHIVYYEVHGRDVVVVRVLHQSRDHEHLL